MSSKNITISSDTLNIDNKGKMKIKGDGSASDLFRVEDNSNLNAFTYLQPNGIGLVGTGRIDIAVQGENFYNSSITVEDRDGYTTVSGSGISQTSLKEFKKNFEKLENGLSIVKSTDIYKYNLKGQKDGDKKHIGFIISNEHKYSQDITAINENGKEIGADLYSMISVAYKAIQELAEKNEKLRERIETLEKERQNG